MIIKLKKILSNILLLCLIIISLFFFVQSVYGNEISSNFVGIHKGEKYDGGIPDDIRENAEIIGFVYKISPELLMSIAWHESRYTSTIISANGKYYGLCQIHPGSHMKRLEKYGLTKQDLLTVPGNMLIAADYLKELKSDYGDIIIALIYYHGEGNNAVNNYLYSGTLSKYVRSVLDKTTELEKAHNKVNN